MDKNVFDKEYYLPYIDQTDKRYIKRKKEYLREYKRMKNYIPNNGKLLDIGCGTGDFVNVFGENWLKFGKEVSDYAISIAKENGINFNIDKEDEGTFDLVILRGSIHYFEDQDYILNYSRKMLKTNGILMILATPNAGSIYYRIFHDLPMLEKDKQHFLLTDKMLIEKLKNHKFDILKVNKPYFRTSYTNIFKDLLYFILRLLKFNVASAFYGNMIECVARKG